MFDLSSENQRDGLAAVASPATVLPFPKFKDLETDLESDPNPDPGDGYKLPHEFLDELKPSKPKPAKKSAQKTVEPEPEPEPEPGTWPDLPDSSEFALRDILNQYDELLQRHGSTGTYAVAGFGYDQETQKPLEKDLARQIPVGEPEAAVNQLLKWSKEKYRNPYFSLSTFKGVGKHLKGTEAQIEHVHGLCVDFDDPDAYKWREKLPPGVKHQLVIQTCALPYPRFQVFFFFTRPHLPQEVKTLATRLKLFTGGDGTQDDLSHVFRLPLWNWPNAKKLRRGRPPYAQLSIVEEHWNGDTIDFEDLVKALDRAMPEERSIGANSKPRLKPSKIKLLAKDLDFNSTAMPDLNRLMELKAIIPAEFDALWSLEREDFVHKDGTPDPHRYDLALADKAAEAGWPPQEILNLIKAFRRNHNLDLKLENQQYFARTILKAKASYQNEAMEGDVELIDLKNSFDLPVDPAFARETSREYVSKKLKFVIRRFVQQGEDEAQYRLYVEHNGSEKKILIDTVAILFDPKQFNNALARQIQIGVPYFTGKQWRSIVNRMLVFVEYESSGIDDSRETRLRELLSEYVNSFNWPRSGCNIDKICGNPENDKTIEALIGDPARNSHPFLLRGVWHVNTAHLSSWSIMHGFERLSKSDYLRSVMRDCGIITKSFPIKYIHVEDPKAKKYSRRYIKIPATFRIDLD